MYNPPVRSITPKPRPPGPDRVVTAPARISPVNTTVPLTSPPRSNKPPPPAQEDRGKRSSDRDRGDRDRGDDDAERERRRLKKQRQREREKTAMAEDDISRTFHECEDARGNARVLSDALAFASPTDVNAENGGVIRVRVLAFL